MSRQTLAALLSRLLTEARGWRSTYFFRRPLLIGLVLYSVLLILLKGIGFFDRLPEDDPARFIGEAVAVTGIVAGHPDPKPRGCSYVLSCESLLPFDNRTLARSTHGLLSLQVSGADATFAQPGDRLRITGRLLAPKSAAVPGTFDYAAYLKDHGIRCLMYTSVRSVQNLGSSRQFSFMRLGWTLHQSMMDIFHRHLTPPQAAVLGGLAVGSRPRFNPEIKKIFVESGTMHILVASGSNVAFVIGLWFLAMRLIRVPRRWALLSSIPAIWTYALLAGADAPIVRSAVMSSVGILSYALAREERAFHPLTVAALSILIPSPETLFDVGFQMSFLTVFGLIYYLPRAERLISTQHSFLRWVLRLFAATTTAQIWLVPITAVVFKRFFPVSLLSNIFIVPMAAGGLAAGFGLSAADVIHSHCFPIGPVLHVVRLLTQLYIGFFISLVKFFATHPGTALWLSPRGTLWIWFFYAACLTVVGLKNSWTCRALFLGSVLFLTIHGVASFVSAHKERAFRLTWIDVGRTASLLIETPERRRILINPGKSDPVDTTERILMPFLAERGIHSLEAVLLTRPDPEDVSGLESLLSSIKVNQVILCAPPAKSAWAAWLNAHPHIKVRLLKTGESAGWDNLTVEGLPGSDTFRADTPLLVSHGETRIILSSLLPLSAQRELAKRSLKKVDLLQGHFSAKVKWDADFVEKVNPITLIETSFREGESPWPNAPVILPQRLGVYEWTE